MSRIEVSLGVRSYPVIIEPGLLSNSKIWQQYLTEEICIVSNETVAPLFLPVIEAALTDRLCYQHILPDGERFKVIEHWQAILETLLENHCSRQVTLIALGGGVVGDITGFAASAYQRGVRFIQIPTTLLAQVDASVGGKTAVNHALGKNMIGAFYQPSAVVIDPLVLRSLPDREYAAGLAEVIKYGLIYGADFFNDLIACPDLLQQKDLAVLQRSIERCCRIKADIVRQDEMESGLRAILNFGHTFGHAIESVTNYQVYLHGEAVAIGMLMAMRLSAALSDQIHIDLYDQLYHWLNAVGLSTSLDPKLSIKPESLLQAMQYDKKVQSDHNIRFVVLSNLGRAEVVGQVDHQLLLSIISEYC